MNDLKSLPSSNDIEKYLLGCMLIDPTIVDSILQQVQIEDFYFAPNKNVAIAIENLFHNQQIVDATTVSEELKRLKTFEATGGKEYLVELMDSPVYVANTEAYIQVLKQKSLERSLLKVMRKITDNILNGSDNLDELLSKAEKDFLDVINHRQVSEFKRIDLLTDNVIEIIEENNKKEGNLVGLDTGYDDLNELTSGFKKGELIIIAARPSIGKSTFALNLAANACKKEKSVAFFSLEMGYDQLIMRLLSTTSGISLDKIVSSNLNETEMQLLLQARVLIDRYPLFIDQAATTNIRDIKLKCRQLKNEGHLDMIVIDYLQLLSSGENRLNRVEEVSKISRGLKEMARYFEIPVVALSQLSRNIEQREDKTPVLADLRESGSIEQDADIVMFLHRETPKSVEGDTTRVVRSAKTELIIAKNRQGMTGKVNLIFKGSQSEFVSEKVVNKKGDNNV